MEVVHFKLFTLAFALLVIRLALRYAPGEPTKFRLRTADWCDTGIVASLITLILVSYVFELSRVEGDSMFPSLHDAEFTMVNKLIYNLHRPERGDIVVFQSPSEDEDYIKRVVAMPGETVSIENGWVIVQGLKLNEPYALDRPFDPLPPVKVAPGHVFVLGDNRGNSADSRAFGPINVETVRGKASFILWPPSRWGFIQSFRGKRFRS